MEKNTNSVSWMHGLEEYFKFKEQYNIAEYFSNFLKIQYSENKAHTLRNVVIESLPKIFDKELMFNLLNFYAHCANSEANMKLNEITSAISLLFPNENLFFGIKKFYREINLDLSDAFSRGQVQSKIWLVNELSKIKTDFNNIIILAGWYGQLIKYFSKINYQQIRIVDIDKQACLASDDIFNLNLLENYKVKAVNQDINNLVLNKNGYELLIENFKNTEAKIFSQKFLPDLIINTSAEHTTDSWYNSIRFKEINSNPIVVIQSNNLFDIEDHVNCVHSVDHMKKKFPMKEILYEGEIQLQGYKRFMLIGRP